MTWSKNVGRVAQEASRGLLCLPSSNTRGNRCLLRSHEDRQPVSENLRARARIRYPSRITKAAQTGSLCEESVELVLAQLLRVSRRDRKVTRTSWSLLAGWPLSLGTVKIYCQRICQKLRVSHQRELTVRALANLHLARSHPATAYDPRRHRLDRKARKEV